ncbi:MAG: hypothetical protein Fur0024_0400 [Patescibacteria group bacterium]
MGHQELIQKLLFGNDFNETALAEFGKSIALTTISSLCVSLILVSYSTETLTQENIIDIFNTSGILFNSITSAFYAWFLIHKNISNGFKFLKNQIFSAQTPTE